MADTNGTRFLDAMPENNRRIFEHVLGNFTKDTESLVQKDYLQAFQRVHHNTGSIALNFGSKLYIV